MRIVRRGTGGVRARRARLRPARERRREEFVRKVRTIAGNFQMFARERWMLNPLRNRLWLQTVSHKALRLLGPLLLGRLGDKRPPGRRPLYDWTLLARAPSTRPPCAVPSSVRPQAPGRSRPLYLLPSELGHGGGLPPVPDRTAARHLEARRSLIRSRRRTIPRTDPAGPRVARARRRRRKPPMTSDIPRPRCRTSPAGH